MTHLKELEQYISSLGWFTGKLVMTITLESEFEGFYGKASEDWEQRITISIKSPKKEMLDNMIVTGDRHDTIDDVAKKVLLKIKENHNV